MIIRFILIILFFNNCSVISCNGQSKKNISYTDFVIKNEKLFALTDNGNIDVFNINKKSTVIKHIVSDTSITAISLDKKGNVLIVKGNRKIDDLNAMQPYFEERFISKDAIFNIVFNNRNQIFIITDKGIYDRKKDRTYLPDSTKNLNRQVKGWSKPDAIFVDNKDNIWLCYGFGEWGGELFIFNMKTDRFIKPDLNGAPFAPIKTIFGDGSATYLACGVDHMSTYGCVTKFTDFKGSEVFSSESHWSDTTSNIEKMVYGEYIGPALYNKKDNCIYFYSQNGIFKGEKNSDLSNKANWKNIVKPNLHWKNGQPNAVGSLMNVLKMEFASNGKLFVLTQNDGMGVYDGKSFTLLNDVN